MGNEVSVLQFFARFFRRRRGRDKKEEHQTETPNNEPPSQDVGNGEAVTKTSTVETKKTMIKYNTNCKKLDLSSHTMLDHDLFYDALASHENPSTLQELTVKNKPKVGSLPVLIACFDHLVTLTLVNNDLHDLPWSMLYLNKLQKLDVSNNNFKHIPRIVAHLVNLRELNFRRNNLLTIPSEILKLEKLQSFDLTDNRNLKGFSPAECKKGVKAVFSIVRRRQLRLDLWAESKPWVEVEAGESVQPYQRSVAPLHDLAVKSIISHKVDFLLFQTVPPRMKTYLSEKAEEDRNKVSVAKCSQCKHFYSSKEMFDNHVCQAG